MENERNAHFSISANTVTNTRRSLFIKKVKNAVVLHDYRAVFPQKQDFYFVYTVREGAMFLAPYQLSILNLFSLHKF